jgi:hypothetical protein
MKVTIVRQSGSFHPVILEKVVTDFKDYVQFTKKCGYDLDIKEARQDFEAQEDVTYTTDIENG